MLDYILSSVICDEFERNVGRNQQKNIKMNGMLLTFSSCHSEYGIEDVYNNTDLLLFAETNYVGVYTREHWTPCNKDLRGMIPWRALSYHDSCWREDGVTRFLISNRERLIVLSTRNTEGWYTKFVINELWREELKQIRKNKHS
jgi:hypothetical protein